MKLYCRSYGSGPPLIILHGLYGSSDNWISIAKMVGEKYTVFLPDLRNHGQSPHSDIMNYDAMRDDLLELAEDLKINKFFLAGHSMGGKTAISFALEWPERLNGLLIADISPFVSEISGQKAFDQHYSILKAMLSLDLSEIHSRSEAEAQLKGMIDSEKVRGFLLKNLHRNPENSFSWKINAGALLNNLGRLMEGIDRKSTGEYRISGFPVIFLKGADSDYIIPDDYPGILNIFPAAEIKEIENAGHWLHADQPARVAESLIMLSGNG
jgi:pimeloyl-ACP methyl ester carboxylesterase